jgi:hypothetical protein
VRRWRKLAFVEFKCTGSAPGVRHGERP